MIPMLKWKEWLSLAPFYPTSASSSRSSFIRAMVGIITTYHDALSKEGDSAVHCIFILYDARPTRANLRILRTFPTELEASSLEVYPSGRPTKMRDC